MRLHLPFNRRTFLGGAAAFGAWPLLGSAPARAAVASLEEAMSLRFMGDESAPLTMIEFFSLGCSHCRRFHEETFPIIKKEYIDTGKLRMEFRDYPLGVKATAASMITRCAPPERYHGLVSLMFRSQDKWAGVENSLPPLKTVAKFGGLSGEDVEACLQNGELLNAIRERAAADQAEYEVDSTPTFIIGENRRKVLGAQPADTFRQVLDEELG